VYLSSRALPSALLLSEPLPSLTISCRSLPRQHSPNPAQESSYQITRRLRRLIPSSRVGDAALDARCSNSTLNLAAGP
jgi:hypothetical protein